MSNCARNNYPNPIREIPWRKALFLGVIFSFFSCIEPYDFVIDQREEGLVVEGYISDVSFLESKEYPSDGRYFSVKLRHTSNVTNTRDTPAENASVHLEDKDSNQWFYTPATDDPGTYFLYDKEFKARPGMEYRLGIELANESAYFSEWQRLPVQNGEPMGVLSFQETTRLEFIYKGTDREIEEVKGVDLMVDIPENKSAEPVYIRWDFDPTWIWVAPLARATAPNYRCWVRNNKYLADYTLLADRSGGYSVPLLFLQTVGNARVYEDFSLLVSQYTLSEDAYYFWSEMKEQAGPEGVFDKPPYNLKTNLYSQGEVGDVFGRFDVVNEQARLWYFTISDLSYFVENNLKEICLMPYGPPIIGELDPCEDCRGYSRGEPTIERPFWWHSN